MCSGISGGTGSGILLDMAYILREVAHAKIPNTITMGFELNRAARPFDYVHLINSRDDAGHILSYEKILMSVAEDIMMHIICRRDTYGPDILRAYEVSAYYSYPYKMYNGYFSLGVSETKMPCREINTLYIARVFENLDISVFKNRPTENQFNVSVFKELEVSEESIRSALYKSVTVPRPLLEVKNYKYAYQAVHNWLTVFQRSVVPQAANLPAYLEGKLKEFIKRNLKDKKTGPFYLRYFLKSQSTYCLDHMLEGFRRYHLELQQQCVYKLNELRNDIQPLEFEKIQEKKFHELAEKDANDFTEYLYENLRKWVGRDIDNVDDSYETDIDIAESLRNFIYRGLYYELGHEDIERNIYTMKLYKKCHRKIIW